MSKPKRCAICGKRFKEGDVIISNPKGPGKVHQSCVNPEKLMRKQVKEVVKKEEGVSLSEIDIDAFLDPRQSLSENIQRVKEKIAELKRKGKGSKEKPEKGIKKLIDIARELNKARLPEKGVEEFVEDINTLKSGIKRSEIIPTYKKESMVELLEKAKNNFKKLKRDYPPKSTTWEDLLQEASFAILKVKQRLVVDFSKKD